jgi:hypothetical protein
VQATDLELAAPAQFRGRQQPHEEDVYGTAALIAGVTDCDTRTAYSGVDFTGDEREIHVSWMYDCRNAQVGSTTDSRWLSVSNNTKFRFVISGWASSTWVDVGTTAPFKSYRRVGGGDVPEHFNNIRSPGCPI